VWISRSVRVERYFLIVNLGNKRTLLVRLQSFHRKRMRKQVTYVHRPNIALLALLDALFNNALLLFFSICTGNLSRRILRGRIHDKTMVGWLQVQVHGYLWQIPIRPETHMHHRYVKKKSLLMLYNFFLLLNAKNRKSILRHFP